MGLKNDKWIRDLARMGMIVPFADQQVKSSVVLLGVLKPRPIISYGLSSYGYDMRVGYDFKIFTNQWPGVVDPKDFNNHVKLIDVHSSEEAVILPPNAFALSTSLEHFCIPRSVLTICLGKSTYARCGVVVNITALEPEWEGQLTIEISNTTPLPVKIYPGEGIAQILFFEADEVCEVSYADKRGKYQGQSGIQLPIV